MGEAKSLSRFSLRLMRVSSAVNDRQRELLPNYDFTRSFFPHWPFPLLIDRSSCIIPVSN